MKAVAVPNAGGQKGIAVAGILGLVGGNPDKEILRVMTNEVNVDDCV